MKTQQENIRLGQCFNLAHAEQSHNVDDDVLMDRTKELFYLLNWIDTDLVKELDVKQKKQLTLFEREGFE